MKQVLIQTLPAGHIVKEETQQTLSQGDHVLDSGLWSSLALIYAREADH